VAWIGTRPTGSRAPATSLAAPAGAGSSGVAGADAETASGSGVVAGSADSPGAGSWTGSGAEVQGGTHPPAAPGRDHGHATPAGSVVSRPGRGEGIVHLNASPWATVYEGSTLLGATPLTHSTSPGPHTFVFKYRGMKRVLRVTVKTGPNILREVQFGP
jgi:hypothetical protein